MNPKRNSASNIVNASALQWSPNTGINTVKSSVLAWSATHEVSHRSVQEFVALDPAQPGRPRDLIPARPDGSGDGNSGWWQHILDWFKNPDGGGEGTTTAGSDSEEGPIDPPADQETMGDGTTG